MWILKQLFQIFMVLIIGSILVVACTANQVAEKNNTAQVAQSTLVQTPPVSHWYEEK